MTMRNPFAKPRTPGQWLLGSVCWTVACVGGWLLADHLLATGYPVADDKLATVFGCFILAHTLIWIKALADSLRLLKTDKSPALDSVVLVAFVWRLLLLLFQLACLLLVPLWYLFQSEAAASSPPWLQF